LSKFKTEYGVTCIVLALCLLLVGLGWALGSDSVFAVSAEANAFQRLPEESTSPEASAIPQPSPADATLAMTEQGELQATRAAARSTAAVMRTVSVGTDGSSTADCRVLPVYIDGAYAGACFGKDDTVYFSIPDFCALLGYSCEVSAEGTDTVYSVDGVKIEIAAGATFYVANGRVFYEPDGVLALNGEVVLAPEALTKIFGAGISYDAEAGTVTVDPSTAALLQDGDSYYAARDLYWLSHIVYAESNTQPFEGMIAVGNVVLNRVASPKFPDSVEEVVFQPGQFSPVDAGTINLEPSEQAILAAKLAIEGVDVAGDSLYFINPTACDGSWFYAQLTQTMVIGDHAFYR